MLSSKDINKELREGDLSSINNIIWFVEYCVENYELDTLHDLVRGCAVKEYINLLCLLYEKIKHILLHPGSSDLSNDKLKSLMDKKGVKTLTPLSYDRMVEFWDSMTIESCENIMKDIIKVAVQYQMDDTRCLKILDELSKSSNRMCRLYCCCSINDPSIFLEDEDRRVQKVAQMRVNFEHIWRTASLEWKKDIYFLMALLENNIVRGYDKHIMGSDGEMAVEFKGYIFNKSASGVILGFNQDVFYNIEDKRILANELYKICVELKSKELDGQEQIESPLIRAREVAEKYEWIPKN